jgi:hypothetical protein
MFVEFGLQGAHRWHDPQVMALEQFSALGVSARPYEVS